MKIKEKIIKESITHCEKRIKFLKSEIFDNDPISKQLDVHKKFNEFLENTKGKERSTQDSINYVNELSDEMDLHKKRAKTYNLDKLMNELTDLEAELKELYREECYLSCRKKT